MPRFIEEHEFLTITLSKAMTLDTINVITDKQVLIRATALSGKWVTGRESGERVGFAATRAYAGDVPFEIGTLINPNVLINSGLYGTANREPMAVWVASGNVHGEAPARY